MFRHVRPEHVSTIPIYDEKSKNKIFGLALTKNGHEGDFVMVMIEIGRQNKISINELFIKKGCLPPYQFEYEFIEWREYIPRT